MSLSKAKMEIKTKFQDLCSELNMDKETEENAWTSYHDMSQKMTLDGDPCQWLCCALYAACRESYRPTVGGTNEIVKGNCVSLTKLLRICNVSLYDFFTKMKSWCEMATLSKNFINQIERLEQGFIITLNLFEWYNKIFDQIFIVPPNEKKNKKSRPVKCSANKLYDLCWCLFLCAKNEDLNCTVDLVSSFHLLLCCIDLIYVNALAENRIELINPNFEGVPKNWNTPEFNPAAISKHCIIEPLCKITKGLHIEARSMKLNSWKKIMTEFLGTKTLLGNKETFMEIISNNNFEPNLKSLNSAYEQYVLSVGEFDERILLHNTNYRKLHNSESGGSHNAYVNQNIRSIAPETPLTRRHHLPKKDSVSEPVASATQNVRKLQDIADLKGPTDYIKQAGESTMKIIKSKLDSMEAIFKEKFPIKTDAEKRFSLAKSLYFYLSEKIVKAEVKTKPNLDLKILLQTDSLNSALITCCVEIVLDAYNSQMKFPWVLNCFDLKPFNFIKIIEIVVKQADILTRGLIKHLNLIEETCLESLAWGSGSPLWIVLQQRNSPLPSWADVDVNKMAHCNQERNLLQSPMNSAYDCFNSVAASTSESARRDLFNAGKASEPKPVDPSKPVSAESRRDVSLSIFLRKFYNLAWMRMKELCKELEMGDEIHMIKVWTLFEYSITHRTELMRDRHLDQLLMCAIYIYIKVQEIQKKTFTDIMRLYRKQPQAASNIYREVLIVPTKKDGDDSKIPQYGDIILFYNTIYVQKMTPYALNFSDKKKSQNDLLLSPHPTEKINLPKKLSNHLYVHQLEKNEVQYSPNHITYEFHKSPAKDLDKLNEIVRRGKRNLTFNDEEPVVIKKLKSNLHFQGKILCIKNDRQAERQE